MAYQSRTANRSSTLALRWEGHDRHPATTHLALVGIPLVVLLAIVGLPPFDIHGPLHYLGIMGPTCGMTRGVMWTARGDLVRAWQFNPASLLVIPTMVGMTLRMTHSRFTGRWLNLYVRWRPWLWIIPTMLILMLTIRQQLNVDLLVNNPAG